MSAVAPTAPLRATTPSPRPPSQSAATPPPVEEPAGRPASGLRAQTPVPSRPSTPLMVQPRPPRTPNPVQVQRGGGGAAGGAGAAESGAGGALGAGAAGPIAPSLGGAPAAFDAKTGKSNEWEANAATDGTGAPGDVALLTDGQAADKTAANPDFDVVFIDDVPAELECAVCNQVLRIPQKLPCEHLFCLACLEGLTECPTCGKAFKPEALREDKATARRIQQLAVKCSFFDNGCVWTGTLKELKAHAISCEFLDTICPRGCGEVFPRRDEQQHLAVCSRKTVPCAHCGKEVSERSMKTHLKLCPAMFINCPNLCGLEMKTRAEASGFHWAFDSSLQIQQHLPSCPKKGAVCPFGEFGCEYTGGRENLQQHIKEDLSAHLSFLCTGVLEFRELVAAAYLNLEKMTRNTNVLQGRIDALEKLYGAQYIWRIDDYRRRFAAAKSGEEPLLFSPPFLSGRHGYKLVLSVALFGDGPAHGQFLSIYVCILKGEHDALLSWPFVHLITLTNPRVNERKHLTYAIKPNPTNENRPYLDRPQSDRNAAFGAQRFCSLADIQPFVREDALFIKCKIDTENMIVL
ncbi:Trf-1 [Aphelenchoides fujianensis]|nr:Trf-1 [Aphelenchoides fujianensis]